MRRIFWFSVRGSITQSFSPWTLILPQVFLLLVACNSRAPDSGCPSGTQPILGDCRVNCSLPDDCLLDEICSPNMNVCVHGTGPMPQITDFHANEKAVHQGNAAELIYATANATAIEIVPGLGTAMLTEGSVLTAPLTSNTTFTLAAYGPGGRAQRSVLVQAISTSTSSSTQPVVRFFTATPNPVPAGHRTILSWATSRATGVTLFDESGQIIQHDTGPQGSLIFMPSGPTLLTLTATSPQGSKSVELSIQLANTSSSTAIEGFTASSSAVIPGANVQLSWSTRGLASLSIHDPLGEQIFQTSDPTKMADGQALAPIPFPDVPASGSIIYTLTGLSSTAGVSRSTVLIQVTDAPQISSFLVNPMSFSARRAPMPVAATWDIHGASELSLIANGEPLIPRFAPLQDSGSAQISVPGTTKFVLTASNITGGQSLTRWTHALIEESEDNDGEARAFALGTNAAINTCKDLSMDQNDWYAIHIDRPAHVVVNLTDESGHCGSAVFGAILELWHGDLRLGATTTSIPGECPSIDPRTDEFARNLVPGAPGYYAHVTIPANNQFCPPYVIDTNQLDPGCPNGVVEPGEDCDDGNTINGDGCSSVCAFEPGSGYEVSTYASVYQPIGAGGRELTFNAIDANYSANDEGYARLNLPFEFTFFGRKYSTATVFVNGYLTFSTNLPIDATADGPQHLPFGTDPTVAALWYDLVIDGDEGSAPAGIVYAVSGVAPHRRVIVDFQNLRTYDSGATSYLRLSAQIVLEEGSNAIEIVYGVPDRMGTQPEQFVSGIQNHQGLATFTLPGCALGWCDLNQSTVPVQETVRFRPKMQPGL